MANRTYIDRYINDGKNDPRSLMKTYDTMLVGDVNNTSHIYRVPFTDFFLKYNAELSDMLNVYSLPQTLYYKPKAVSLETYGTTELWLAILRANNMKSVTEFCKPMIWMYEPASLIELIKIFFKREGKL